MTSLILLNGCLRVDDNPLLSQARGKAAALVIVDQQAYFGRQYGLFRSNLAKVCIIMARVFPLANAQISGALF